MAKYGELKTSGIKCDNQTCDYKDETVGFDEMCEWIDRSCPKCGENLLTKEDYHNVLTVKLAYDLLNGLSEEQLKEIASSFDINKVVESPMFEGAEGVEHLTGPDKLVNIRIDTHKSIKVTNITPTGGQNDERGVTTEAQ